MLIYQFVLFVACLTMFVNCLVKQFAMCLSVVAVFLLIQYIPCHHPSSPRQVIAFTLKKTHVSMFLLSHTQRDHHHISFPLEPLTERQPPQSINLTLATTLHISHFLVDSSCVHTVVLSHLCRNHSSIVSCHTPGLSPQKSYFTHFYHISFQA